MQTLEQWEHGHKEVCTACGGTYFVVYEHSEPPKIDLNESMGTTDWSTQIMWAGGR